VINLLVFLAVCCFSSILYRAGGSGNYPRQLRVVGCPFILMGLVLLTIPIQLTIVNLSLLILTLGLSIGAISTYWDWLFGYDNFFAHGLGCSLATIPLYWVGVPWWILLIHGVICTLGMGLWSKLIGNDVLEECGRGVLFIL